MKCNESCGNNYHNFDNVDLDDVEEISSSNINNNGVQSRFCKFSDFDFGNAFRMRSKTHLLVSDMTILGVDDFGA